jgi:hypothetical protein
MWTERLPLAFPVALIDAANQLGAVIDPDTGGALTFSPESIIGNYVIAEVPFTEPMRAVVMGRNSEQWQAAIAQRAAMKGMESLPVETIEALRAALLCGDECVALGDES